MLDPWIATPPPVDTSIREEGVGNRDKPYEPNSGVESPHIEEWEIDEAKKLPPLKFSYVNHANKFGHRTVHPIRIYFGTAVYYKEPQWLMCVWDVDKQAIRNYAMNKMNKHPGLNEVDVDDLK